MYYVVATCASYKGERLPDNYPHEATTTEVLTDVLGTLKSLDKWHSQKITHRDIKPANILHDEKGEIHLCDPGLARHIPQGQTIRQVGGVVDFMAPEVAFNRPGGLAADMWSVGMMLACQLTFPKTWKDFIQVEQRAFSRAIAGYEGYESREAFAQARESFMGSIDQFLEENLGEGDTSLDSDSKQEIISELPSCSACLLPAPSKTTNRQG